MGSAVGVGDADGVGVEGVGEGLVVAHGQLGVTVGDFVDSGGPVGRGGAVGTGEGDAEGEGAGGVGTGTAGGTGSASEVTGAEDGGACPIRPLPATVGSPLTGKVSSTWRADNPWSTPR